MSPTFKLTRVLDRIRLYLPWDPASKCNSGSNGFTQGTTRYKNIQTLSTKHVVITYLINRWTVLHGVQSNWLLVCYKPVYRQSFIASEMFIARKSFMKVKQLSDLERLPSDGKTLTINWRSKLATDFWLIAMNYCYYCRKSSCPSISRIQFVY